MNIKNVMSLHCLNNTNAVFMQLIEYFNKYKVITEF